MWSCCSPFLQATQSDALARLEKLYGDRTRQTILNYINNEVNKKSRSLLDVLKHGVEFDNGVSLTLMYRKHATTFNQKAEALYQQNVLSVMEEVWHKEGERIDLVIFLNGIAIFTFELKCNTSGQNYEDAIRQYKFERDYKTRLLKFKAGCLAHFAMDLKRSLCVHQSERKIFFLSAVQQRLRRWDSLRQGQPPQRKRHQCFLYVGRYPQKKIQCCI